MVIVAKQPSFENWIASLAGPIAACIAQDYIPVTRTMKRVRENFYCCAAYLGSNQNQLDPRKLVLSKLALGELEALAGALLPVLLALLAARVAREKPFGLQLFAEFSVEHEQRAGNAHANCVGLSVNAAAGNIGHHIKRGGSFARDQRLLGRATLRIRHKILIESTAVHREIARAGTQENPRYAGFAPSRAIVLNRFCHSQSLN